MITARLTDVSLVAPEAASALLGKSGAMLLLGAIPLSLITPLRLYTELRRSTHFYVQ